MARITVAAAHLRSGDKCAGCGGTVSHTYTDGLYWHNADGSFIEPRARFQRGKVEVFLSYTGRDGVTRRVWNARTGIAVDRPTI